MAAEGVSVRCIYCRTPNDGTSDRAHTFPEAVTENRFLLPRGAICKPCNRYFSDLDTVLAQHPFVAVPIQFLAIPGKGGRPRRRVGGIEQVYDQFTGKRYIQFRTEEPTVTWDSKGRRSFAYQPFVDGSFDLWKFRRSLHYVALNAAAHALGVDTALDSRFDRVRQYVRYPDRRTQHWPYMQSVSSFDRIREEVDILGEHGDECDFVGLRIFNTSFGVDLRNSGEIALLSSKRMPAAQLVGPEFRYQRSPTSAGRQYRLTIETNRAEVGPADDIPKPLR